MKRRELLRTLASTGLLVGATVAGWTAPALAGMRTLARRSARVPADLLARIHRRTRPLDPDSLEKEHDLAG